MRNNLLILERKNPLLALRVSAYSPLKPLKQGFLKLAAGEEGSILFIYALSSLNSLGSLKEYLTTPNTQVIALEKEPGELAYFLTLEEMTPLLEHPNFECYLIEDFYEELYLKIAWQSLFFKREFVTAFEGEVFFSFKAKMEYYLDLIFLIASECSDYKKKITENFYRNSSSVHESKKGDSLRFSGVPAIICGAGPSIQSQLDLLRSLGNKALIFAGGSLLPVFSKEGIMIHFGAMIDPDPPYQRFYQATFYETPFFYQMRLSHQILRLIHGQKLLGKGSGGFPLESYFFEGMDETKVVLESGWNVANFMATLAAQMGCNPIILIGMDMAYQPTQEYVEGVEESSQIKGHQFLKTVEGEEMLSRKDLLMGRLFFSQLVKRFPRQRWINSTHKGLVIEGMEHLPFEKVVAFLDKEYDLKGIIHSHLMEVESYQPKKIQENLKVSFERTSTIVEQLLIKLQRVYLHQKENPSKTLREGELALEEIELEEEIVYKLYLGPLWQVWKWIFFHNQQKEGATIEGKLRQFLFFAEVVREHRALFNQIYQKDEKVYETGVLSF